MQAYLDVRRNRLRLAKEKGVDAIHPGYGFLSENPALPRACEKHGITFIGPSAELLQSFSATRPHRRYAIQRTKAGIPVVPGTESAVTDPAQIAEIGAKIGFPLIVKAAFGGGGRGMRVVERADRGPSGAR